MIKLLLSLEFIILTAGFSYSQIDSIHVNHLKDFDLRVGKIISEWKAAGCAIGIVKNGKVIYSKGFGYRDVYQKLPVTTQTLFRIASNTKLFTASAAGLLVHEKKLDWDQPITKWVPSMQFNTDLLNNSVTLRDMLSHRTGLGSPDMIYWGFDYTKRQIFEKIRFIKPDAELRSEFIYNNLMYITIGHIIELKSNKPYEQFIKERLLEPLEMKSSVFTVEEMFHSNNFAKPYISDNINNKIDSVFYFRNDEAHAPAGGLISNLDDLNNWVICHLNYGKFRGREIIPHDIFEDLSVPNSIDLTIYPKSLKDKNRFYNLYAFGQEITSYKGHAMTFHDGGMNGYSSKIVMFPNDSLGIVILTNSNGQYISSFLAFEIADRILNLDKTNWHEDFMEKNRLYREELSKSEKPEQKEERVSTHPPHKLIDYSGKYENDLYGCIEVKKSNHKLFLLFGRFYLELKYQDLEKFKTIGDELIEFMPRFHAGESGKIEHVDIDILGVEVMFKKKE